MIRPLLLNSFSNVDVKVQEVAKRALPNSQHGRECHRVGMPVAV